MLSGNICQAMNFHWKALSTIQAGPYRLKWTISDLLLVSMNESLASFYEEDLFSELGSIDRYTEYLKSCSVSLLPIVIDLSISFISRRVKPFVHFCSLTILYWTRTVK
jgi:hypothetical protein